jgi:hypothetical protein
MDSRLVEIAELISEVNERIQEYNSMVKWRGNSIISVYFDETGKEQLADILMSRDLPKTGKAIVKSPLETSCDGGLYFLAETAYNDKVKFSSIHHVQEGEENANMAV